jgi:outer membrane protein assembly factor BamD
MGDFLNFRISLALCLLCAALACGAPPPPGRLDAEDQYLLAQERYDDGKFEEAQLEFQKLIWNYPGSDYVDDAQYYLAECHRYLEDYPTAIIEYSRLLRSYSQSPFAPAAQYHLALCYFEQSLPSHLDQNFTHKAIGELQIFLEEYPHSEFTAQARDLLLQARTKLAKKDYENARLYLKMNDYESAIIYVEEILDQYGDTKWAVDAQYLLGECYRHQEKWQRALRAYRLMLEMNPSKKLQRQAEARIRQVQEALEETTG